jgi:hypothetical protein
MTIADEDRLEVLLKEYNYANDEDLVTEGISQGDNFVIRFLDKELPNYEIPETPPDILIDAATLYTGMAVLDILLSNQDKRSPTAIKWEEEAKECLEMFVSTYEVEESTLGTNIGIITVYNADQMEEDAEDEE